MKANVYASQRTPSFRPLSVFPPLYLHICASLSLTKICLFISKGQIWIHQPLYPKYYIIPSRWNVLTCAFAIYVDEHRTERIIGENKRACMSLSCDSWIMSRFIYIPESDDQNENVLQADASVAPEAERIFKLRKFGEYIHFLRS